eukprot:gnl/MRDRNA2_/MRDRNA2_122488_c0_seq1.p1 gnl/MRDRNA2_/MRDRNA2_122488_c0~~gnl/MRDRNA2_/MRDRNA2_122488_c0_seq1.p1  ORF type:complete len:214 (+),score=43.37 gnl/MRDRNA2_/MRDRNA2_122488_c0_seq1:120-761(+)
MPPFADSLTKILSDKAEKRQKEATEKQSQWHAEVQRVTRDLVKQFQIKCIIAANCDHNEYETDIEFLLKHYVKKEDSLSLRHGFYYSKNGIGKDPPPLCPLPVPRDWFNLVIEDFMKIMKSEGFVSVERKADNTDVVRVVWRKPDEPPLKKQRVQTGNIVQECGICKEKQAIQAAVPCGHVMCSGCYEGVRQRNGQCPFCKQQMTGMQLLFKP